MSVISTFPHATSDSSVMFELGSTLIDICMSYNLMSSFYYFVVKNTDSCSLIEFILEKFDDKFG